MIKSIQSKQYVPEVAATSAVFVIDVLCSVVPLQLNRCFGATHDLPYKVFTRTLHVQHRLQLSDTSLAMWKSTT